MVVGVAGTVGCGTNNQHAISSQGINLNEQTARETYVFVKERLSNAPIPTRGPNGTMSASPAELYDIFSRSALAALFGIAVIGKFQAKSWLAFKQTISRTVPIPTGLIPLFGVAALSAEIGAIVLLVSGAGVLAYLPSVALLAIFLVLALKKMAKRDATPCHCFGADDKTTPAFALLRNATALAVGLSGLTAALGAGEISSRTWSVTAAGIGLAAGLLMIYIPRTLSKPKETA